MRATNMAVCWSVLVTVALLSGSACDGGSSEGTGGAAPATTAGVGAGGDSSVGGAVGEGGEGGGAVSWPDSVTTLTLTDGSASATGNFDDGVDFETTESLQWLVDIGCMDDMASLTGALSKPDQYMGTKHLFYGLVDVGPDELITVTATPEADNNVGLYVYRVPITQAPVPPDVSEVSFCRWQNGRFQILIGEGEPSKVGMQNPTDQSFNYLIGVSGDAGTSVEIDVSVEIDPDRCIAEDAGGIDSHTELYPEWITEVDLDDMGQNSVRGELADGAQLCSLDFAATGQNACFTPIQFDYYNGNHRFYKLAESMPSNSLVSIAVVPDPGVTVSLWGYRQGPDLTPEVPPGLYGHQCEADYGDTVIDNGLPTHPPDPGVAKQITFLSTTNSYDIVWGVSSYSTDPTSDQGSEGGFTVSVQLVVFDDGNDCEEDDYDTDWDEDTKWTQADIVVLSQIDDSDGSADYNPEADGDVSVTTDENVTTVLVGGQNLSEGAPLCTLNFASSGQNACFVDPDFDYFRGNHRFYSALLPAASEMTITVQPDPGVEVSVWGYRIGSSSYRLPPALYTCAGCEAGFANELDKSPNPGEAESLYFINPADDKSYNIVFAVAGYDPTNDFGVSGTDGAYSVGVEIRESLGSHCPESLPGATYPLWPGTVELLTLSNGTASTSGNLDTGACTDLEFANTSFCFPTNQFDHFEGNVVMYALSEPMPPRSTLDITLTPESGLDANLFGYRMGTNDYNIPPDLTGVFVCEADYPSGVGFSTNPGETETIHFENPSYTNTYHIAFGVAGPTGVTSGSYSVDVELAEEVVHCEESLPGDTYTSWPASVQEVTLDGSGDATVSGNLSTGECTNLEFAENAQVACFPSVDFDYFEGNHNYYYLDGGLPPNSTVNIWVQPDPGVDVSLYGYSAGTDDFLVPPNVGGVLACEAHFSPSIGYVPNPGEPQSIFFNNPSDTSSYSLFFAVAGNETDGTSGGYEIEVHREVAAVHCSESLPGSSHTSWPTPGAPSVTDPSVTMIDYDDAADGSAVLLTLQNLATGFCTNLDWAAYSSVACFPSTDFDQFDGTLLYYALDKPLPPDKKACVRANPSGTSTDVSVFGYLTGTTTFYVPPFVPSVASVCEYGADGGDNVTEDLGEYFYNTAGDRNVFIGVAGAGGTTTGTFALQVEIIDVGTDCGF